jgi:hypothetical protein
MVQIKVVEKTKTHILRRITFFSRNHAVFEIVSKNMIQSDRPQMTT